MLKTVPRPLNGRKPTCALLVASSARPLSPGPPLLAPKNSRNPHSDYRGLKKKITAIRRAQQGQQFNVDTESPDEAGSQTPDAPPATPRPSFSSSVPTEGVHVTPRPPTRERSESTAVQSRPVTPRNKKGLTISTSGIHHNESAIADSPSFTRRNTAKTDEIAHSTGVDGHTMPELPRRPSLFSRGSFSVARSISSRGESRGRRLRVSF
jgi:hypothetical protein